MRPSTLRTRFQAVYPFIIFTILLLVGIFVTLCFIGADGHLIVLAPRDAVQEIVNTANDVVSRFVFSGQLSVKYFYRGAIGFPVVLEHLFFRLRPFMIYGIFCALLYGALVLFTIFQKGRLYHDARLSVLHVLGFSLFGLWLMTTTLFYSNIEGLQQRIHVEPNTQVYEGADNYQISALQENFDHLLNRGCLIEHPLRKGAGGARIFRYSGFCMQKSFFTRVLPPFFFLMALVLVAVTLGRFILWGLRTTIHQSYYEAVISFALGIAGIAFIFWVLAVFHSLHTRTAWGVLLLIPIGLHRFLFSVVKDTWQKRGRLKTPFFSAVILLSWLLVSYVLFNYLTVIRSFPIGWDDLGHYINNPRQMSVFNMIIPGMESPKWEYITSIGFLLFGYGNIFAATLAQQINWFAGVFAILAVIGVGRVTLGPGRGLLAATLYYTLPMVGHFSFADMKTENALFAFAVVGLLCVLIYLRHRDQCLEKNADDTSFLRWQHLALLLIGGILLGAGFTTKPTIILLAFMSGIILTFGFLGSLGGIGSIFLCIGLIIQQRTLNVDSMTERIFSTTYPGAQAIVMATFFLVGIGFMFLPVVLRRIQADKFFYKLKQYGIAAGILVLGTCVFVGPWMIRNMIANKSISIGTAISAPNKITPEVNYLLKDISPDAPKGSRALFSEELLLDPSHERCIGTAGAEELDRYWGYGSGIAHYLGLPWRNVMNIDSQGYYLTLSPLLLLVPLILLYPAFWKKKYLRWLLWGSIFYLFMWVIVGNGIPWYGIGLFLGLVIIIESLLVHAPDVPTKILVSVFVVIALCLSLSLRMWQFEMQRNLYEYAWGKSSHDVMEEMTIPDYGDIARIVEKLSENPERPFLYRMGTFIPYFIPRSIEVIPKNDNQLGFFKCLNQEKDHKLTLKRLLELGFHSMVFDTNTATIERDPNGTLHQKVQEFVDFLNDPALGIVPIVNSPERGVIYVILPENVPEEESDEVQEE